DEDEEAARLVRSAGLRRGKNLYPERQCDLQSAETFACRFVKQIGRVHREGFRILLRGDLAQPRGNESNHRWQPIHDRTRHRSVKTACGISFAISLGSGVEKVAATDACARPRE